jgi:hypothetical protein
MRGILLCGTWRMLFEQTRAFGDVDEGRNRLPWKPVKTPPRRLSCGMVTLQGLLV